MQPLHVVAEPEDRRPFRRVVAANALEDAGAVMQAVDADMDLRVGPVDELAVHPDLLGLLHRRAPFSGWSSNSSRGPPMSTARPRRGVRGRRAASAAMCCGGPGADPDHDVPEQLRSISAAVIARCGNGATPPGSKPVACTTSSGLATRTSAAPTRRAIAASSARRSPGTSASTKAPSQTRTSDLTIWPSSQPTASAASRAVGVPSENSSIRASTAAARRTCRDALDGLRPGRSRQTS